MDTFLERYAPSRQTDHGPRRSKPGQGEQVKIHVLGPAEDFADGCPWTRTIRGTTQRAQEGRTWPLQMGRGRGT